MYFPLSEWLPAFGLTIAIEAPIVWWLLWKVEPDRVRLAVLFLTVNLATHLVAWYVVTQLVDVMSWTYPLVAETWAIAAEATFFAVAFRGLGWRRAIGVSGAANVSSFLFGSVALTLVASWVG
jgi:hypothetical protein